MYLSRLSLNPRNRRVRADLSDCHELHRTLLSIWPQFDGQQSARAACEMLYRTELGVRIGDAQIVVQSRDRPDWSGLPDGYVLDHQTKPLESVYGALTAGMRLRFRMRANPTKRESSKAVRKDGRPGSGKRVDLRHEEDQIAWLERKGREQCGFRVTSVRASADVPNLRAQPEPQLHGRRGDARLTFGSVLFEGELEITDAERFRQALEGGIGSGKAYGFGLLSIGPVRR